MKVDNVSAWLKEARKRAGLTQKELGVMCELSDTAIRQYEKGLRIPKIDNLIKLSIALGHVPDIVVKVNPYAVVLSEIQERIRKLKESEEKFSAVCLYAKAAANKAAREELEELYTTVYSIMQREGVDTLG